MHIQQIINTLKQIEESEAKRWDLTLDLINQIKYLEGRIQKLEQKERTVSAPRP